MSNIVDLSHLRKPEANATPEPAEEVIVKTFTIPRGLQPAPRNAFAIIDLGIRGQAAMSIHAEGACLFLEVPGEDVRIMPREALIEGWLPPVVASTRPAVGCDECGAKDGEEHAETCPGSDDPDPVAQRVAAEREDTEPEKPLHEVLHEARSAERDDVTIGIDEVDGAAAGFVGAGNGPLGFGESLTVGVDPSGLAHLSATFGEHHCSVALPWKDIVDMVAKVSDLRAELDRNKEPVAP